VFLKNGVLDKAIDQGIEVYRRFYTQEQEEKFGIVAIEIERL